MLLLPRALLNYKLLITARAIREFQVIQLYLGEDQFLRDCALNGALRSHLGERHNDPLARLYLHGSEPGSSGIISQKIMEAGASLSMFSDSQTIVLRDADHLSATDQKELASWLRTKPPCDFFLDAAKLDARTEFYKALKSVAQIETLEVPKHAKLNTWIVAHAKNAYGRVLQAEAAGLLVELLGSELALIDTELGKLHLNLDQSKPINFEAVENMVATQREFKPYEAQQSFGMRDAGAFQKILHRMLLSGLEPVTILSQLHVQAVRILQIQEWTRQGLDSNAIASKLHMNPFVYKNVQSMDLQAKRWNGRVLSRVIIRLVEIEKALKTGGLASPAEFAMAVSALVV